jgi:hypothetical protein
LVRDNSGKFVKGHANLGAGRKKKTVEAAYLDAFKAAVSQDDWKSIIEKAVKQAKAGDSDARKFIASYLIGMPVQRNEITGEDGKAIVIKVKHSNDANL